MLSEGIVGKGLGLVVARTSAFEPFSIVLDFSSASHPCWSAVGLRRNKKSFHVGGSAHQSPGMSRSANFLIAIGWSIKRAGGLHRGLCEYRRPSDPHLRCVVLPLPPRLFLLISKLTIGSRSSFHCRQLHLVSAALVVKRGLHGSNRAGWRLLST